MKDQPTNLPLIVPFVHSAIFQNNPHQKDCNYGSCYDKRDGHNSAHNDSGVGLRLTNDKGPSLSSCWKLCVDRSNSSNRILPVSGRCVCVPHTFRSRGDGGVSSLEVPRALHVVE